MQPLPLHEIHAAAGARFCEQGGFEAVSDFGDWLAEHAALTRQAAVVDLSHRGRFCVVGSDRVELVNGQVTNDIKTLTVGQGRRAAFCGPKGRMIADAHLFSLGDEILVDVEPGRSAPLIARLEHHIVAEDAQIVDAAPHYGLLSVQGPRATSALARLAPEGAPPEPLRMATLNRDGGAWYLARVDRLGRPGFDLYAPTESLPDLWSGLVEAVHAEGGRPAGFTAWEAARFEAGVPRFGIEMDESTLPPEAGLDRDAISYSKGCYTGQETIARIRTYGQVSKALRGLRCDSAEGLLPARGAVVKFEGNAVGAVVSALDSPAFRARLAMAYLRRDRNAPGTRVTVALTDGTDAPAIVTALPFNSDGG